MKEVNTLIRSAASTLEGVVNITEFQVIGERSARVIASVVGRPTKESLFASISDKLRGATPVKSSFRWLEENRFMTGFVSINPEIRMESDTTIKAKYRAMAANLYMDEGDESLWELRDGAAGKFLARQGQDNLAELLEASRVSPMGSTPRLSRIIPASARKHEMLAFVATDANVVDIDYGFCVETGSVNGERAYRVVSTTNNAPVTVRESAVVAAYGGIEPPKGPEGLKMDASADTDAQIKYYRMAYSYSPEYIEKIIRQVEQMASL